MEEVICKYLGREGSNKAPEEANWRRRNTLQSPENSAVWAQVKMQSSLQTTRLDVNNRWVHLNLYK